VLLFALPGCERVERPFATTVAGEPTVFAADVVSTASSDEYGIVFTPDGREAYFTRSARGRRAPPRVFVTHVVGGAWSEPEPASFSTGWEELPYLTPDGARVIFSSRRDVPGWGPVPDNDNLWTSQHTDDGWSPPVPLPGEVNRPRLEGRGAPGRDERSPTLFPDGTLLYSTQEEPGSGEDIYVADDVDGRYVNVRPMLLNSSGNESGPALSPDGRLLVFHGYRDPYATDDDLFVAQRTEYGWSEPRRLEPPVNGPANERFGRFSPDGSLFFFSSDREGGSMSIYYVSVEALGILPPPG